MRLVGICVALILAMSALNMEAEAVDDSRRRQQSSMAYVTLLYGDEFLLGVRVLGKSIKDTGTTKDMVALVSNGVTSDAMELLEADGWIVTQIELLANPNSQRPARFWGVYTKLKVFNMTAYEKVVFLDADTIVTQNIEDLFGCQKFCANLKHSERLNSGVMVVEPSAELFKDMFAKVGTLRSYTGGDQGFLNSYYEDFANARLFDPKMPPEDRKNYKPKMERLSTLYNADVGLFVLANKWMVDNTSELRVVHYTLGPLKPWDWWTHWLLKPVDYWQDIRVTLPASLPGTRAGQTPHERMIVRIEFLLPLVVLAFLRRRSLCQVHQHLCGLFCGESFSGYARQLWYKYSGGSSLPKYSTMTASPARNPTQQYANGSGLPSYLGSVSIVVCFSCLLLSLASSVMLIPKQVMPWTGMILAYEWTFFGFFLSFGKYLDLVHGYGRKFAVVIPLNEDPPQYRVAKGTENLNLWPGLTYHLHTPARPKALAGRNEWIFLDDLQLELAGACFSPTAYIHWISGHVRPSVPWDMEGALYGFGILGLAIAVPSVSFVFGVSALFGRLGLTIFVGIIFAAFLTYSAEHLAIRWYLLGRDGGSQQR